LIDKKYNPIFLISKFFKIYIFDNIKPLIQIYLIEKLKIEIDNEKKNNENILNNENNNDNKNLNENSLNFAIQNFAKNKLKKVTKEKKIFNLITEVIFKSIVDLNIKCSEFDDIEFIKISKSFFDYYEEEKKIKEKPQKSYESFSSQKRYNISNYLPDDDTTSLKNVKFYMNEIKSEPQGI
jgi:hypothetical protein